MQFCDALMIARFVLMRVCFCAISSIVGANQTAMGKQLEEFHSHQWTAIKMLQSNQESLSDQLKEIRSMLVNLVCLEQFFASLVRKIITWYGHQQKEQVTKQVSANEKYGRLLDDIQRDNAARWVR
ncbi:hypothetical protein PsorP6_005947 [Peronosclerospora sorghi]|uniref:Uncharacterized protein n=1 Tax=Peronosclerospora sorghi TaxID=230839 RepID=A0ACC0W6Y5_9STRA|nr:hypothetical protein PsorP6_005947 [Peronosclerospora sorghi]